VALPGLALGEHGALVAGTTPAPHGRELAAEPVLEEAAHLGAERPVVGALPQVHAADAI
jgi:hypothetical protein